MFNSFVKQSCDRGVGSFFILAGALKCYERHEHAFMFIKMCVR